MRIAKKGDLMQAEREMRQNDAQERNVATSKAARSQKLVLFVDIEGRLSEWSRRDVVHGRRYGEVEARGCRSRAK